MQTVRKLNWSTAQRNELGGCGFDSRAGRQTLTALVGRNRSRSMTTTHLMTH